MILPLGSRDQAIQLADELQLTEAEKIQAFRLVRMPADKSKQTEQHFQQLIKHFRAIREQRMQAPSFEERVFNQLAEYPQCKWAAKGVAAYLDKHRDVALVTPEREELVRLALEALAGQGCITILRRASYTSYCI